MPIYLAEVKGLKKTKDFLSQIGDKTGFGAIKDETQLGFYDKIATLMNVILGLVGILAAIYLIYSGIRWLRSGGNEEVVKEAKDGIRAAIWGLLVVFSGFVIVNFVIERLIRAVGANV